MMPLIWRCCYHDAYFDTLSAIYALFFTASLLFFMRRCHDMLPFFAMPFSICMPLRAPFRHCSYDIFIDSFTPLMRSSSRHRHIV